VEKNMPRPQAEVIKLSPAIRAELEVLAKGHKTEQQIAKRAQIIIAAAAGQANSWISRRVGVTRQTVINWRRRWLALEAIAFTDISARERLRDLPRPGSPARITAEQRCQLEALACSVPEESGRPISQWTGREIADELIKRNIVETISPRHAVRLLKRSCHSTPSESLLAEHGQR
jgi:putative transposase